VVAHPPARPNQAVYQALLDGLRQIGVTLSAALPDDWVAPLADLLDAEPAVTSLRVAREPEIIAICSGAFFGGARAVGIMGATGFLACVSEIATLNLRHQIPVFLIVSQRGSIDDHRIYQEVQGRRTLPLLQAYDFPYHIVDRPDEVSSIPDAFETCRMQKRPFVLFLTRRLVKGEGTA